ncbi:condensation domain-containing protein, partial [Piscinibacter terrae]
EAPQGEVETAIASIWAEVLQLDRVGRHDNFFELGGHSLLAVTVIDRMRAAGLESDVRRIFATPTVAGLSVSLGRDEATVVVPPNLIPAGCQQITPAMLPMVSLTQEQIARIVAAVPGGHVNVQDIYPLAPLQEGILFHHRMAAANDPYLQHAIFTFDTEARLHGFVAALQAVVRRHDILRTSVAWEGLPEPVQVVWRDAPIAIEQTAIDPAAGDAVHQLRDRFHAGQHRLDLQQAPLLRGIVTEDTGDGRWALLILFHHMVLDHTTLEIVQQEVQMQLLGRGEELARPKAFREFVGQARLGMSRQSHEAFFRRMLGTVEEPTAPYGLMDVQGDGSAIAQAQRA